MSRSRGRIARRVVRIAGELFIQVLIGFSIAAILGISWGVLDGTRLLTHIGHVAIIAGGIWLLGGSGLPSKMTMMQYMQYGVRARPKDLIASDYSDIDTVALTPFGSSLIVGTVMIVVGVSLL